MNPSKFSQSHNSTIQPQFSVSFSQNSSSNLFSSESINWIKSLSPEQRRIILIFKAPHLVHSYECIHEKLMDGRKAVNKELGDFWKKSKNIVEAFRLFLDGLVFLSVEEYMDSIGFSQAYVKKPEKIFQILLKIQQIKSSQNSPSKSEAPYLENPLHQLENWVILAVEEFKRQIFTKIQSKPKKILLSKQKDFIRFWQDLSSGKKKQFIKLDNDQTIVFENKIREYGSLDKIQAIQYWIKELYGKLKEEPGEKMFRQTPAKTNLFQYFYCEILYEKWNSLEMKGRAESQVKSGKSKRPKSVGAMSNETNQTDIKDKKIQINISEIAADKVQKDIIQYSDMISMKANSFYERRILAFQRLKYLLEAYGIQIKLYGSCACGIAIQNSDLDVAVDESILGMFGDAPTVQKQVNKALQTIQYIIQTCGFVTEIKLINSAYIPIIKFTIDTCAPFMCENPYLYNHLNRSVENGGCVRVDLTIQTKAAENPHNPQNTTIPNTVIHLGIKSTTQINNWLQQYPTLRPILLILKNILTLKKLHQTYNQGLNTYSLVVMLVAVFTQKQLQNEKSLKNIMETILKFYGEEFQEQIYGIDIRNQKVFYYKEKEEKVVKSAQLEVRDPLNYGKIMTKNCYRFKEIKEIFRSIYGFCIVKTELNVQEKCSSWNPKEKKINSNQLSQWVLDGLPQNMFQSMFS